MTERDDDLRYLGYFEHDAARFTRGEGIWYGRDAFHFACTNGGEKKKGQIWRYYPSRAEGTARETQEPGKLELFIEPNGGSLVGNRDNVTMAPWGDLIVSEDGTTLFLNIQTPGMTLAIIGPWEKLRFQG